MSSASVSRHADGDGACVEEKPLTVIQEDEEKPTRDVTVNNPAPLARQPITTAFQRSTRPGVFNIEDNLRQKSEIKILRAQLRQTQNEYRNEQELGLQLKRRLNGAERTRLDDSVKVNQEAVALQTQVAKFRCQVERVEADKQAIEFDLAKVKRDVVGERKMTSEKDGRLQAQADALRDQVKSQDRHLQELGHQANLMKQTIADQDDKFRICMEEKQKHFDVLRSELEYMAADRSRLETSLQEKDALIYDVNDKQQELEEQLQHQNDVIRKQMTELVLAKDREDTTKEDLEAAEEKLRMLEQRVEAERAAHLESKFNSEIVQLKVKDLEGALESEKTVKVETSGNYETLVKQHKDLLEQFHALKTQADITQHNFTRMTSEYEEVRTQLGRDVGEKQSVIKSLSDQLSLHENNFEQLKDELNKTKKRQMSLEDTYGGSMRELELLLDNFDLESESKKARKGDHPDRSAAISPSAVLESLRHTLLQYKKNLNITCEELSKMKKHYETLGKECESYKDMIWTKDQALDETQRGYAQTSKDLNRFRSEFVDCEAQLVAMKAQLQAALHERDRECNNAKSMSDEIQRLAKKVKCDDDECMNYLHSLYQRVVIGKSVSEPRTSVLASYKWPDLSIMVQEQVSAMVNTLTRTEDKVTHLEQLLRNKDEMMSQIQRANDDQLDKLEKMSHERETAWTAQKDQLEQHYSRLLAEVHVRSKKSQTLADQAWERVRATGSVQQGLEGECMNLMNSVDKLKHEQSALLCACALLAGAFFPLYSRFTSMASQHKLLDEQADQASSIYAQARVLVDTLGAELECSTPRSGKFSPVQSRPSGLVRFRIGVISVLAANRLLYFRQSVARMFTSYDLSTGLSGLAVWCGGVETTRKREMNDMEPTKDYSPMLAGQRKALQWLTSDQLRQAILQSTMDIQDVITHSQQEGPQVDSKLIIGAARTSFAKLTDKLSAFYPTCPDSGTGFREKTSLVRQLGNGLTRVIMDGGKTTKNFYSPPQQLMARLQQHLMDLAKRLHDSEVDKRNLEHELNYLAQESDHLRGSVDRAVSLEGQVTSLKNQTDQMIAMSRFDEVYAELNEALAREQHGQKLLTKQARQIEEVTVKLDCFMGDDKEHQRTVSETIQSLSDTKLELRHKEQEVRALSKNLSHLETDNTDLLNNVKDAEMALRTTTRDRDTLCQYIKNVESALDKAKHQMGTARKLTSDDTRVMEKLLSPELLPIEAGKSGPEALACQRLVTAFVDAQHQLLSRFLSIEEERELQKKHIQTLKYELNAACQREYNEPSHYIPSKDMSVGYVDLKPTRQPTRDGQDRDEFKPLSLDPDTPKFDQATKSPVKIKKSAPSKTKSSKPSTCKSKPDTTSRRSRPYEPL